MKPADRLLSLIILSVAVFSIVTSSSLVVIASSEGAEHIDDGAAPPAPDESRTEDDGWVEGDYEGSLEEQEEQAQEDWEDAGRPGENEDEDNNENEIPNCDFDEFVNDDNECEKIPEDPVTAALPPCDGSFQDCVTPEGNVCLAGASTHECELPNPGDETVSPGIPFPEANEVGFVPDEDCLFDTTLPKCTPPEGVDCPAGFGTNEDGQCFPFNEEGKWECPDGYHSVEDDETGQCYPDSEGCPEGMISSENGHCIDKSLCEGDNPVDRCPDPVPIPEPDPDYPPYPPDQDCDDIGKKNIKVPPGDPHSLYRDKDGIGCEDNEGNGSNNRDKTKVIQKTTVINSATASASATTAEVSSCKLDGSADGILQKFDTAKYQACGLYVEGQKAYSDGFVVGCTQVGNTHLICQSFVDSSKLNMNIPATQTPTHATMQPTPQGITPAAVNN